LAYGQKSERKYRNIKKIQENQGHPARKTIGDNCSTMNPHISDAHGMLCMRHSAWITLGMVLLLGVGGMLSAQEPTETTGNAAARRTLQAVGLTQAGKYWIVADEAELRRQIALLPREEKLFYAALQQFRTLQGQFQIARGQLQKSRSRLAEVVDLLGKNSTGSLERQQLEGESKRVAQQISTAEKTISGRLDVLDESSEMTTATIDLVNAQTALAVRVLNVRRLLGEFADDYQRLKTEKPIQDALAVRTAEALGPVENYGSWPHKLDRIESLVLTDGVPFYRRSGQIRVTAILDERLPVTFSYQGATGPTLLPASALSGLQIDLAQAPPGEPVELEQSSVPTRRVILPTLRIGKFVWRQVPVDVLPAEADYLGARISQQAFDHVQASVEEGKLWFRLHAAE
jgi:hypothetical protein